MPHGMVTKSHLLLTGRIMVKGAVSRTHTPGVFHETFIFGVDSEFSA